jgi:hypothetical protein
MAIGLSRNEIVNSILRNISTPADEDTRRFVQQIAYGVAAAIEENNEKLRRRLRTVGLEV